MIARWTRLLLAGSALALACHFNIASSGVAQAQQPTAPGDLFYNFYAPSAVGGPPAQMYLSPVPTPPYVGHTYITYQPLMPHEFLYKHSRQYTRFSEYGYPVARTYVHWW